MNIIAVLEFVSKKVMVNGIESFREVKVAYIEIGRIFEGSNDMMTQNGEIS